MRPRVLAPLLLGALALAGAWLPGLAGPAAIYPALGVFPGMAFCALVAGGRSRATRTLLGLTLSPLVATVAAWTLMRAGLSLSAAARTVAITGWAVWMLIEALRHAPPESDREDADPPALLRVWSLGLAIAVAIPPLVNPWIRVHYDSWVHAGIAWELFTRGLPPQDPRFAGLHLNYVWFYNYFIALLTGLRGQDPFVFMAVMNVVCAALCVRLMWRVGFALWRDARAANAGAVLVTVGFNAASWMLWPLWLLRAMVGRNRGWAEIREELGTLHLFDERVIYSLSAPFAHMVSFLDKFLLGTALGYAWLLMLLLLWAVLEWVRGAGVHVLAWAALAAAGMLLFHFVPGLSVVPVMLGALVLVALLHARRPWLPGGTHLAPLAFAILLGALATVPYTLSITRGWAGASTGVRHSYFHPGWQMPWTLLTSCGIVALLAWRPLRRALAERNPAAWVLAIYLGCLTLFSAIVHLTEDNEHKFAFFVFAPLTAFAGAGLAPAWRGAVARFGRAGAVGLAALVFAVTPLLTLIGYVLDPSARGAPQLHSTPGEAALESWLVRGTDPLTVVVDAKFRDLLMVKARRRLYYGSLHGPERAGFPMAQVVERRAVMADLYGAAAELDRDAVALRDLGAPVLVTFRPEDLDETRVALETVARRPDLFRPAYDRDGYLAFALVR